MAVPVPVLVNGGATCTVVVSPVVGTKEVVCFAEPFEGEGTWLACEGSGVVVIFAEGSGGSPGARFLHHTLTV